MTIPETQNFLSPVGFKFTVNKLPNFEWFVQKVNFPGIQVNRTNTIQTPFTRLAIPGDHIQWDTLSITFKVDEDMYAYTEIADWLIGIGKPESFTQYSALANTGTVTVDADLLVLNSTESPNVKFTFNDISPFALSGLSFSTTDNQITYITATAQFQYRQWVYERII